MFSSCFRAAQNQAKFLLGWKCSTAFYTISPVAFKSASDWKTTKYIHSTHNLNGSGAIVNDVTGVAVVRRAATGQNTKSTLTPDARSSNHGDTSSMNAQSMGGGPANGGSKRELCSETKTTIYTQLRWRMVWFDFTTWREGLKNVPCHYSTTKKCHWF